MKVTQLKFDLFDQAPFTPRVWAMDSKTQLKCKQAVLRWLLAMDPTGIGMNVPTRISRFQVDIGAFWSAPDRKRQLHPRKTAIVEMRFERCNCWPDISKHEDLLGSLREVKNEKQQLEAQIRHDEPELRVGDNLFTEIEDWDYAGSHNPRYHLCLKRLEEIQHALYAGSRFEQIRRAHSADFLYLAVPSGLIDARELANGWGLLYIEDNFEVKEIKKAQQEETSSDCKLHFIQNLAASAMKSALFAAGVNINNDGKVTCTLPPRRRGKKL